MQKHPVKVYFTGEFLLLKAKWFQYTVHNEGYYACVSHSTSICSWLGSGCPSPVGLAGGGVFSLGFGLLRIGLTMLSKFYNEQYKHINIHIKY